MNELEEFEKFIICDMILSCTEMRNAFYLSSTLTDSKLKFVLDLNPPKEYVNSFYICQNSNISTRLFLDTIKWQYNVFDTTSYKSIMNTNIKMKDFSSSNTRAYIPRKFSQDEQLEFFAWLSEKNIFKDSNNGYENIKTFFYELKPNLDFVKTNSHMLNYHFKHYGLLGSGSASRDFERYFTKEDFVKLKDIYKQYSELL